MENSIEYVESVGAKQMLKVVDALFAHYPDMNMQKLAKGIVDKYSMTNFYDRRYRLELQITEIGTDDDRESDSKIDAGSD